MRFSHSAAEKVLFVGECADPHCAALIVQAKEDEDKQIGTVRESEPSIRCGQQCNQNENQHVLKEPVCRSRRIYRRDYPRPGEQEHQGMEKSIGTEVNRGCV